VPLIINIIDLVFYFQTGRMLSCEKINRGKKNRMFDNIVIFTQLIEIGNFGKTAEYLNLSPSTLTRKIQDLENYLNKQLLIRDTRNIELTSEGSMVYLQFKDLRGQLNNLYKSFNEDNSKKSGILNVILPIEFSYGLISPYLSYFIKDHPDIKLNVYYELRPDELKNMDINIIITRRQINYPEYISRLIRSESIQLYCTPQYALKNGMPLTIEDIGNHNLIGCIEHSTETNSLDYITFTNKYTHEKFLWSNLDNTVLKTNMSTHSLHIGLAGEHIFGSWSFPCSDLVNQGKLLQVLPEWYAFKQDFYLYCRKKTSPLDQTFIDFINRCMNHSIELCVEHCE